MNLFRKRVPEKKPEAIPAPESLTCPHTILLPRWDSIEDMGQDSKATSYTCQSCSQTFTGDEGRALRA